MLGKIVSVIGDKVRIKLDVSLYNLDNLMGKSEGLFSGLMNSIKGLLGKGDSDGGILNQTNDDALGADAIIDSTLDVVKDTVKKAEEDGLFDKIINFFQELTSGK